MRWKPKPSQTRRSRNISKRKNRFADASKRVTGVECAGRKVPAGLPRRQGCGEIGKGYRACRNGGCRNSLYPAKPTPPTAVSSRARRRQLRPQAMQKINCDAVKRADAPVASG